MRKAIVVALLVFGFRYVQADTLSGGIERNSAFGSSVARPRADWDYDGRRILGHVNSDIYIWDAHTGNILRKFIGDKQNIISLQFSPDAKCIISSSGHLINGDFVPANRDFGVETRVWSISEGKELWRVRGHIAAAFSYDGKHLLTLSMLKPSGGEEAGFAMWDLYTGKKTFDTASNNSNSDHNGIVDAPYTHVAISPDSKIFIALDNKNAELFSAKDGSLVDRLNDVGSFNYIENGGAFSIFNNQSIEIRSQDGHLVRRISENIRPGMESAWTSNGQQLVVINFARDKKADNLNSFPLEIIDILTGRVIIKNLPHATDILVRPNSKQALLWWGKEKVNAEDRLMAMSDIDTGTELWHMQSNASKVIGFSPDGRTILVGGPYKFYVYQSDSGSQIASYDLLAGEIKMGFGTQLSAKFGS